jgi:ribosomal protein L15
VDSGRNCSAGNLGTLSRHGITELRFAGGLWETSGRSGVTMALFSAPGLTVEQMGEFYESGAREARKTEAITTAPVEVSGLAGRRLDTLNDESFQTIIVLEDREPDLVRAVLVASNVREVGTREAHEAVVQSATDAAVASIEAG